MDIVDLTSVMTKALLLTLWLSMPTILVASIVGVLFSLVQALTQIQEQTLSFAVKLISVGVTLYLTAHWMGGEIFNYAAMLFAAFPSMVH